MTPLVRATREAFLEAGRVYAEVTERGESERGEALMAGAKLRIAAKRMWEAERAEGGKAS